MMEFGSLIQKYRKEKGWDVRKLSAKSSVDLGAISRIENGQTHALIVTAIRLCKALSMDPAEMIDSDSKNRGSALPHHTYSKVFLNDSDLASLSQLFSLKPISTLNNIVEILGRYPLPGSQADFHVDEYQKMRAADLGSDRLSELLGILQAIKYPKQIDNALIMKIQYSGGAISLLDFGNFMRNVRKGRSLSLAEVQELCGLSDSTLCNFERGNIQRIKLSDILILDKVLKAKGEFFHLIWNVSEFQQMGGGGKFISGWPINERILFNYVICVYRWLQLQADGSDASWLTEFRSFFA